jgi:predicted RecB family nuclease
LLICIVIVLDAVYTYTKAKRHAAGIANNKETLSDIIQNRKVIDGQHYLSDIQGLAGKPDAIILENNYIIPVERKPFAKKLRDRYIAQLLVYMRLIEEFEGIRPPYGYLILGKNCRRVKIMNTPERQAWLQTFIDEMQAILSNQAPAIPSPHPQKCNKCAVKNSCNASYVFEIKSNNRLPTAKVG